jgi:hypothetical protein
VTARRIGEGSAWLEGDDLVVFQWVGTIGADETAAVMEWCHEIDDRLGRVFLMLDMRRAVHVNAAGRRQMVRYARARPLTAAVLVGARFQLRVVVNLVINALNMLRDVEQPFHFADTEEEGRQWLNRFRLAGER